jgi:NADPH:quinone reductase-like Zn-dependent oxidoreductase/ubiquinone/menaquinone biosynthesis C-methylase UbiE
MEDAMSVAYHRGVVASQVLDDHKTRGAMMAVGMSAKEIQQYIDRLPRGQLVVACVNSPSSVTVSGDTLAVAAMAQLLKNESVFSRSLAVDVAYHSPQMALVADEYRRLIEHIEPQKQNQLGDEREHRSTAFFSSVTGAILSQEELGAEYWVSNLLGQVKFSQSVRNLCFETNTQRSGYIESTRTRRVGAAQKANIDCLIEIGPHSALAGPVKQILQADTKLNSADIVYASVLKRQNNAVATALGMAATLASLNHPMNFGAINSPEGPGGTCMPQLLVDLPPYPWNHTRSYWAEPRLSKMYRNRRLPRNDLLGAPDNMSCPYEPRWRNFLRTSELPWLLDHKIQGNIVFPAAGYLAIAIEASMQLVKSEENIARYVLQEVLIKAALVLNETSAIELMVSIRESTHKPHELYEFHIYSISQDNQWIDHCTGLVGSQRRIVVSADGPEETDSYAMVPLSTEVCGISVVDVQDFYEELHEIGLEYGPCFANLTTAHVTQEGACFAEVTVPDTRSVMPRAFQYDLLIHPCTLDSIFHTVFAALPPGMDIQEGPVIPISIEEMIVSSGISSSAGGIMSVCTHVRQGPKKDVMASIVAVDCNDKQSEMEPSISIRGLRCTRLERDRGPFLAKENQSTYRIEWKADPYFLCKHNAYFLFDQESEPAQDPASQVEYEECAAGFIRAALEEISAMEARKLDTSHRRFQCHLQDVLDKYDEEQPGSKSGLKGMKPDPTEDLLRAIGENLVAIIRAQVDFTDVINDHHLLDTFWDIFSADSSYTATARYLDLVGHKKPDISILEFGVGTGQVSKLFLEQLANSTQSCCGKYTFAHESPLVLEHTAKRLEAWSELVDCKSLDPGKDLFTQGFEKGSFDIVILPHGLCTAQCEQNALSKIYELLKPSGSLIAISPFNPKQNIVKNILFSALHCLSAEEFCLGQGGWSECQWDEILRDAHFTAVDVFADPNCEKTHQFIVARRGKIETSTAKVSIICEGDAGIAVGELVTRLEILACEVNVRSIDDVDTEDRICVVLDAQKGSLLAAPDDITLGKIKGTLMHSAGVLWLTRGGAVESVNPNASLAVGFARTARAESGVNPIVTLDLDAQNPLSDSRSAELIANLLATRFLRQSPNDDTEFAERNGTIMIPRVLEDSDTSTAMLSFRATETVTEQYFHRAEQPLRLSSRFEEPRFVGDCALSELPIGYVGIRVHAFGLSEQDLRRDTHDVNSDDTLGLECSGVVYNVGVGVHGISIGDRVACLGTGTARSFYHDRAAAFQKIGDKMSFELASALPVAYSTAYYIGNYHSPRLQSSDVVLVHRAGCWCGQAIVELYKMGGAQVFATVQDPTEKLLLSCRFGIPTNHIFIHRQDDVVKSLMRLTDGKKANLVVSLGTDDEQLQSWTAPFGHFIRLFSDKSRIQGVLRSQNISLSTFNICDLRKERRDLADHIWSKVFRLFREGRLKGPSGTAVYNVSHIQKAIEETPTKRYVVVSAAPDDLVMVNSPFDPKRRI